MLPEASGLDLLEDAVDALHWASKNVTERVISAGTSGGGYVALATAANPKSPPLLAVFAMHGMLDPTNHRYVTPGIPLPTPGPDDLSSVVKSIESLSDGKHKPISGYTIPSNGAVDPRAQIIRALHLNALYPDVMTREKGLAAKIREQGVEVVPEQYRVLFPAAFGLNKNLPPVALLHGNSDKLVDVEHSTSVSTKLEKLGVKVLLKTYQEGGHGFDGAGSPPDVNIDEVKANDPPFFPLLRDVLKFLESTSA